MQISAFLPGCEEVEKIDILIGFTKIDSDEKIEALKKHLVDGMNLTAAAAFAQTDVSNLRKSLATLEYAAQGVEELKEMAWPDYQMTRFKKVS